MRKYEAIFILNDRKFDDGGEAFSGKVEEVLKQCDAKSVSKSSMGRRQFARPIGKRTHGLYWSFGFEMTPGQVENFQDKFRLEENVLRHVVLLDDKPKGDIRTLQLDQ
ncbi:MAG: 30S ribosomal protein S6 [Lentisphaeraceae bacterium]|nr:30S ribosomal protein S6 [Lentisphaeraceae bacterium]